MPTKAKGNIPGERGTPCPKKKAPSSLSNCHVYIFPYIKQSKSVHFWKMCSEDSCFLSPLPSHALDLMRRKQDRWEQKEYTSCKGYPKPGIIDEPRM